MDSELRKQIEQLIPTFNLHELEDFTAIKDMIRIGLIQIKVLDGKTNKYYKADYNGCSFDDREIRLYIDT